MRRIGLVALLVALSAPPAQAAAPDTLQMSKQTGLTVVAGPTVLSQGRAAIERFARREQRLQGSAGYKVDRCRQARRAVMCVVYEYGVPDTLDLFDTADSFDLDYRLYAQRTDGRWRFWSPDLIFG